MKKFLPVPNERWVARTFTFAILAYLAWTGYVVVSRDQQPVFSLAMLSMLLPVFFLDGIKTMIESLFPKKSILLKEDLSKVTVIIPTYNGEKVLPETLKHLVARFPKKQIIVSSNGSTDKTCEIASNFGVELLHNPKPIGKVEAINQALSMVKTEFSLILDDDTLISNATIPTNILESGYGAVAFRVMPVLENWVSQFQIHEYRKSMDIGRKFHNQTGTVQNVSGAIGLYKTNELKRQILLHSGEFSGEDLQRTLLVHLSRETSGGVVLADSVVETLAPNKISDLFKQRVYGWNPGFLATSHLYFKLLFKKDIPFRLRYEAFYNSIILAILDPIRLLSLPVLLFNPVYIVFFYVVYVLLESVPYLVMGKKEPFWVILLYPLYGIFNFVTRILGMSVFFYRRCAYWIGRAPNKDGYRQVGDPVKWGAAFGGLVLSLVVIIFYAILATAISDYENIITLPESESEYILTSNAISSIEAGSHTQDKSIIEEFEYPVGEGDSMWRLVATSLAEYKVAYPDSARMVGSESIVISEVLSLLKNQRLVAGDTVVIPVEIIDQAIKNENNYL